MNIAAVCCRDSASADVSVSHARYTVTGSEDGILRLWNSRDVYEAAAGLQEDPCCSQSSDSTLQTVNGEHRPLQAFPVSCTMTFVKPKDATCHIGVLSRLKV